MLLDSKATLVDDTEQAKRAIEGGTMVRRRFQRGSLFKRGKREKVWVARWWEDVINADGTMGRMRRSIVIGTIAEFATRRLAMRALSERLRSLNSASQRPHLSGQEKNQFQYGVRRSGRWHQRSTRRHLAGELYELDLGYFDLETLVLEPLENPFGPKVLPMS
jgi:hypothetical protein